MAMKWCTKLDVIQKSCPIVFQGHPSNFKVTWDKKIANFYPNWAFPDCNSSLNIPMALKCCTKLNVVQKRCPFVFQGHPSNFKVTWDKKIANFYPNWAFPDCNSSLNIPMALKCCTKLNVVQKRCPIVFQGHPSNFKVTWDKKIANFYPNWAFPDCDSSLNIPMALKWCTKLNVVQKRYPIVFEGRP